MIRNIRTPFPMVALVLLPLACAPPADEADSRAIRVADGVYQFNAGSHNAFFVDTDGGVVAFDPISMAAAAGLGNAIRERLSHHHRTRRPRLAPAGLDLRGRADAPLRRARDRASLSGTEPQRQHAGGICSG